MLQKKVFAAIGWGQQITSFKSVQMEMLFLLVWTDTENPDDYNGSNGAPDFMAGLMVD